MTEKSKTELVLRAQVDLVNTVFKTMTKDRVDVESLLADAQRCQLFQAEVNTTLEMLTPREINVLVSRFGLNGNGPASLEKVGARLLRLRGDGFGVSRE